MRGYLILDEYKDRRHVTTKKKAAEKIAKDWREESDLFLEIGTNVTIHKVTIIREGGK